MRTFLDCWIKAASALLPQALAGEPGFFEAAPGDGFEGSFCLSAVVSGEIEGSFAVLLASDLLEAPLLGEGVDARSAWAELLREVAEAAAAELHSRTGRRCSIAELTEIAAPEEEAREFEVRSGRSWRLRVWDRVRLLDANVPEENIPFPEQASAPSASSLAGRPGLGLLLDVELETTLRFGCRELQLAEVLGLGPGDVVQLDRHISDPVDLIVGDKIVAHGEVVLVNGNFGLRVTEVAAPRERLESIRCLF